jgi:hypothetical protein
MIKIMKITVKRKGIILAYFINRNSIIPPRRRITVKGIVNGVYWGNVSYTTTGNRIPDTRDSPHRL